MGYTPASGRARARCRSPALSVADLTSLDGRGSIQSTNDQDHFSDNRSVRRRRTNNQKWHSR